MISRLSTVLTGLNADQLVERGHHREETATYPD
jgi:hypothetical protein